MPPAVLFAFPVAPDPTRRAVLHALALTSASLCLPPSAATAACKQAGPPSPNGSRGSGPLSAASQRSVRRAAQTMRAECGAFLAQLRPLRPDALLWRGREDAVDGALALDAPKSDLLDDATYGPDGAAFFRALDGFTASASALPRVRVSHLGTGCMADAAAWGHAVSVWPRGKDPRFASRDSGLVYDPEQDADSVEKAERARGPLQRRVLRDALKRGDEILFECEGWYAVPAEYVDVVLDALADA